MNRMSLGIHHITAIASGAQATVDFYTKILGLRLVKKSVNQDQVEAYHLFFGDKTGEPGMDLTFFTFPEVYAGRRGPGLVTSIGLAVREESLPFWLERFVKFQVEHDALETRFGHKRVVFYDGDNQRLELVGVGDTEFTQRVGEVWTTNEVSDDVAIGYFYSARLSVLSKSMIEPIVTEILGFEKEDEDKVSRVGLYKNTQAKRGGYLEIEEHPDEARVINGAGTVHHIAFQVADEKHLLALRKKVAEVGLYPTEVINRFYFKSVYFRTPAGILFELATNGPGFTVDEDEATLGQTLKLPPWLEGEREEIEEGLERLVS